MDLEPIRFKISVNASADAFKANVMANLGRKHPRLSVKQCAIVGGGPSVVDHLEEIRRFQADGGDVFAINGSIKLLIQNGVAPVYGILYDSRPENAEFILPNADVFWNVASHCHPSVFEKLEKSCCAVYMFHSSGHEGVQELIRANEPSATILAGTSTGGLQALSLVTIMGYKVARLYGYDSSARGEEKHAYTQPLNADQTLIDIHFNDKVYRTSAVMAEQAKLFAETYGMYESMGLGITVIGEGLLPDMWRAAESDKGPITAETIEELEAAKYAYIWGKDTYRRFSPGEILLDHFLKVMEPLPASRIVDFGCGPGRATAKLASMGFDVLGVDHASNCLDVGVTVPLCISNLWRLPKTVTGHYGLCCDVMEHIPPQHVDEVLKSISSAVTRGCYFHISFRPDTHGDKKTGSLHLTVKPEEWWEEKLSQYFFMIQNRGDGSFVCLK